MHRVTFDNLQITNCLYCNEKELSRFVMTYFGDVGVGHHVQVPPAQGRPDEALQCVPPLTELYVRVDSTHTCSLV